MSAHALAPSLSKRPIARWPSEVPLRVLVILASIAIWAMLVLTIFGAIYAAMIALFLFFTHVAFVAHVRGSGVRLGPEQFPQLWDRVVTLSRQAGMPKPPDAYLMQAGGELNAFATKFFGGRIMVLYSELLEACGEDHAARDMVIGHELGHLAMRHLDWFFLTAPGRLLPFLGSAYSRACEYSCDRWGAALCGDQGGALRGLTILAAGPRHAGHVNLKAFAAQRQDLDTGWMTIGNWLSGYPPLSARVEALQPELGRTIPYSTRGPMRAAFLLTAFIVVPPFLIAGIGALWAAFVLGDLGERLLDLRDARSQPAASRTLDPQQEVMMNAMARRDLEALAAVIRAHHQATGTYVADIEHLEEIWHEQHPDRDFPTDPFDGEAYGLSVDGDLTELFSAGDESIDVFDTGEN